MSFADPAHRLRPLGWARDPDRIRSGLAVIAIHLLLGFALLRGLGVSIPVATENGLTLVNLLPPPPPTPPEKKQPPRTHTSRKQGAASPPNIRSKATEVVTPPPPPLPVPPPPVLTAPKANIGVERSTGAAPVPGPGTGAGGVGNGTGSGDEGNGQGDDGGTDYRLISGLKRSDFPAKVLPPNIRVTVYMRWTITAKGRVTNCQVTRSSGYPEVDAVTCELITKRLRYEPSRDAQGRPVADVGIGEQTWYNFERPPAGDSPD